ncbi:MAG: cytochrome c3 family protein [Desulfobacteraceae bacterium]|nr:cytochrome c3 family protein [Desulfobacteraceae bacterium]
MNKPWKLSKSLCVAAGLAAVLSMGTARASVIDAPHNDTHGVACGSCHAYSLWWQYSPTSPSSSAYGTVTDGVCNSCHGPGGAQFQKVSHSSVSMGSAHNATLGDWSTKCVDCHNPHLQQQLSWLPATATFGDGTRAGGLYLVEGTISGITDNGNGTTTITYTNADAASPWADTSRWTAKEGTAGRGLILTLGYTTGERTYEIVAASASAPIPSTVPGTGAGSITVQNGTDTVPATYNGTNFGIIYGQLIKSSINTPNSGAKSVQFFDPQNGGYVSSAATPTGICQVCHTKTTYWRNDGSLNIHNVGSVCTSCHNIAAGFKPVFPDHNTFIAVLTSCGSCHTQAQVVEGIHNLQCSYCHAPSGPPALNAADPNTPFRVTPTVWPSPAGQATPNPGDCGQCHGSDYFLHHKIVNQTTGAADHTNIVNKTLPNCVNACHFHNKTDPIADIHQNKCTDCHNMTPNADGTIGANIGLAAQYGPGDCMHCHTDIAASPLNHQNALDHSTKVMRAPTCTDVVGCHPGNLLYQVHPNMCVTCHEPTYFGLQTLLPTSKAIAIVQGDCTACHKETANVVNGVHQ